MSAKTHQCALESDTGDSAVQQLLSLFLARALLGWAGREGSQSVPGGSQAGKVSQWYSQFLPWVSAGGSIATSMYITSHSPYPQTPCPALCSVPINHVLQAFSTLLSITVLHKCVGIWKPKTHSSSPNSATSSCSFHFHRENSHQAQEMWQTQTMDTTGVTKVHSTVTPALLIHHYDLVSQQTTKQSYHSTVIYNHGFLPTTITTPWIIRPSRMISLSRTNNFYFQGKKLNWQSKRFVKHKARNNTFSFKRFFTASSLQIFALSLQKIPKKFSVYSISESHNLQKNK